MELDGREASSVIEGDVCRVSSFEKGDGNTDEC